MIGRRDETAPRRGGALLTASARWPLAALAALALAGYVACLIADFPGHFSPDSIWQLAQGRAGAYDDWHPPVMAWLLGLADRTTPRAAGFIAFDAGLFFAGLLAFATLEPGPRPIALPVVALVAASPIVLIYQGDVWKDVLFADSAMAGFAALAWAGRLWANALARWFLLAAAAALFAVASLTRQNGFVVALCAAAALGALRWIAPGGGHGRALRPVAWSLAGLALVSGVAAAATWGLSQRRDGEPQYPRQLIRLQSFDLAGAARAGYRPIRLEQANPAAARFIEREAAPAWVPAGADNLERLPGAPARLVLGGRGIGEEWRALATRKPILYLELRSRVFLATLRASIGDRCPNVFVGVDPATPDLLADANLKPRYDAKDEWDDAYVSAFVGTPVMSHLFYGALLLTLLALAARQAARAGPSPGVIVTAAMGTAALLFTASFFVISSACDYRYLYFLDVAAMAALVRQVAARPPSRRR